jgi:predicted DNA-binding transcriptional regulator AlpA
MMMTNHRAATDKPDVARSRVEMPQTALLVTARQAAAMCGKSLRTWRTWDAAGLIPRPVRIGRSTLWRAEELRSWVHAGCPRRQEWEPLILGEKPGQEA